MTSFKMKIGFILLFFLVGTCFSEKILFLLPIASRSHYHVFEPLIRGLGERGHEITSLTPLISPSMPPSVTQIQLVTVEEVHGKMLNTFEQRKIGMLSYANSSLFEHVHKGCIKVYENPKFHEVIASKKFDLVIIDVILNYCFLGAIPQLDAPSILLATQAPPSFLASGWGDRLPPSFVPGWVFTDRMSFLQRLINTLLDFGGHLMWQFMAVQRSEEIYRKYLPNGDKLPGAHEIEANASMFFTNSHFTLTYPRPLLPDVVEVGGMHTRPSKKLPKELDDFLSNSGKDGVIFFSLGSLVKATDMPEEYRKVFINVFSKLKQRVIWKWETETMPDLPPNVKLSKWLPQQDILGHPNVRLFMTHGGLLSIQESVFHGVPVLGLPMFGDQDINIMQGELRGFAKLVEINDITEERLENAIKEMLNDPSYGQKAKAISKLVKDLPQAPLDKAIYWTEYVLRHKGAPHLRSASRDLNFIQYYVLDVTAVLLLSFALIIYLILSCCKSIYRRTCKKKAQRHVHFKKE